MKKTFNINDKKITVNLNKGNNGASILEEFSDESRDKVDDLVFDSKEELYMFINTLTDICENEEKEL